MTLKLRYLHKKLYSKFHYFKIFISPDSCETWKFQFILGFCTDLWDTLNSKNIKYMDLVTSTGWEKIPWHMLLPFSKMKVLLWHQDQIIHRYENVLFIFIMHYVLLCTIMYISIILQLLYLCVLSFGVSLLRFEYPTTYKNCKWNVMI